MASTDILSLEEAQAVIGAPGDAAYDDQLERVNSAMTALIETRVGPVVYRTITDELHDGSCFAIKPLKQPVSSISSVIEGRVDNPTTLIAEGFGLAVNNGYQFDPTTGFI